VFEAGVFGEVWHGGLRSGVPGVRMRRPDGVGRGGAGSCPAGLVPFPRTGGAPCAAADC